MVLWKVSIYKTWEGSTSKKKTLKNSILNKIIIHCTFFSFVWGIKGSMIPKLSFITGLFCWLCGLYTALNARACLLCCPGLKPCNWVDSPFLRGRREPAGCVCLIFSLKNEKGWEWKQNMVIIHSTFFWKKNYTKYCKSLNHKNQLSMNVAWVTRE